MAQVRCVLYTFVITFILIAFSNYPRITIIIAILVDFVANIMYIVAVIVPLLMI